MTVARLYSDYVLKIKGEIYIEIDAVDDLSEIDESHVLDTEHSLGAEDDLSSFFNFLFGIPVKNKEVDFFMIDRYGNLLTSNVRRELEALNDEENIDTEHLIEDELNSELEISHFFEAFFGITKTIINSDGFSILKNGELIVNDVLENQQL